MFFIGAGPGSPSCLTLEGAEALKRCGLVFAFDPYPETFSAMLAGKEVRDPFSFGFSQIVSLVEEALPSHSVGFLVPGDMAVFSPFLPLVQHFGPQARVLPGVGILNAAAARLRVTLDVPSISSTVVLASVKHMDRDGSTGGLARLAALGGTLVLYMNNRPLPLLAAELAPVCGADTPAAVVARIGQKDEKVFMGTLSTIAGLVGGADVFGIESSEPSMAVIIVGTALASTAGAGTWNHRRISRRGGGGQAD